MRPSEAGVQGLEMGSSLLVVLCALCLVALGWLYWAKLDVVVIAPGQVVATGFNKPVQAVETGRVSRVLVQEGDLVQQGQVVIELEASAAGAEVDHLVVEARLLAASEHQLRGLLAWLASEGADPGPRVLQDEVPQDESTRSAQLAAQWRGYEANQAALAAEAREQRSTLEAAREQGRQRKAALEILDTESKALARLRDRGMASRLQWSELERQRMLAAEAVSRNRQEQQATVARVQAVDARRQATRAEFAEHRAAELDEITRQARLVGAQLPAARLRLAHCQLRAPASGRVEALKIRAAGEVARAGDVLMDIVPDAVPLMIEAGLRNEDVARVDVGQPVVVKFESFHDTRFGLWQGKLTRLAADASKGPGQEGRYRAEVRLLDAGPGAPAELPALRPGMQATVEFMLGRRQALDYLLGPLWRHAQEAAREP